MTGGATSTHDSVTINAYRAHSSDALSREKEVKASGTARARGERVPSIAKRFYIHRATLWEHTRLRPSE